jgi:hypothetical protein
MSVKESNTPELTNNFHYCTKHVHSQPQIQTIDPNFVVILTFYQRTNKKKRSTQRSNINMLQVVFICIGS